jgi:glyoxylase-like metal-dependent hydrolase (beta-lactamase superfamily II)
MHTVTIGTVEITALLDSAILMNPRTFMPAHADQFVAEYASEMDERGLLPMAVTSYLLRSSGKNVLVDTGLGPRKRPGFPHGRLPESLDAAGIAASDIDVVIHTHLHIDHVGWNTFDTDDGKREIFFPNARFVIQQAEWDYWMHPDRIDAPGQPHLRECVEPLRNTGRITFTKGEETFDENIVFISTPGHTPGHVAVGIASGGERAVIVGDASHHPVQLVHPDWSPSADSDPVQSTKSRDRLFNMAADDGRTWIAGHWEHPGFGRIIRLDGKRVFRAL